MFLSIREATFIYLDVDSMPLLLGIPWSNGQQQAHDAADQPSDRGHGGPHPAAHVARGDRRQVRARRVQGT